MRLRVACFCGHIFDCVPPALCPSCGELVMDPADRAWLDHMRDEIGDHTTTTENGEAW